jgi:hypothetical protein
VVNGTPPAGLEPRQVATKQSEYKERKLSQRLPAGSMSEMGLKYEGLDADKHILDTLQLSTSLEGNARLYRLVAHYCFYGEVIKPRSPSDLHCFAMPSKEGSFEETLVIITGVVHQIPAFADVYKSSLDWLISKVMGYIKDKLSGQGDVNELAEIIKLQTEKDAELKAILANGLIKSNDQLASLHSKLIDTLPLLVEAAQPSMRKALRPVGKSCSTMTQFTHLEEPVLVSEAEALAIRSDEDLVVGKADYFNINRFHSLSLDSGACRIEVDGYEGLINGKVDDITLKQPANAYSNALNLHLALTVRARPVFKNEELHRLFITEAD